MEFPEIFWDAATDVSGSAQRWWPDTNDCVELANYLIVELKLPIPRVGDILEINSHLLASFFKAFNWDVPGMIDVALSSEDELHNVQTLIDTLSVDKLHTSLSHIAGEDVVLKKPQAVYDLLELLKGWMIYVRHDPKTGTVDSLFENILDVSRDGAQSDIHDYSSFLALPLDESAPALTTPDLAHYRDDHTLRGSKRQLFQRAASDDTETFQPVHTEDKQTNLETDMYSESFTHPKRLSPLPELISPQTSGESVGQPEPAVHGQPLPVQMEASEDSHTTSSYTMAQPQPPIEVLIFDTDDTSQALKMLLQDDKEQAPAKATPARLTSVLRNRYINRQRPRRFKSPAVFPVYSSHEGGVLPPDRFLQVLQDEFQESLLASEIKKMYHRYRITMKRISDVAKKDSRIANEYKEAVKKQLALSNLIKKDIAHNQRMRNIREQQQLRKCVASSAFERRRQHIKMKQYYENNQARLRSQILAGKTQDEKLLRELFEDYLQLQTENFRQLYKEAATRGDVQFQEYKNYLTNLEYLWEETAAMMTESFSNERCSLQERAKAQSQTLEKLRRELRQHMEQSIRELQEHLVTNARDTSQRELQVGHLRQRLLHRDM